MALTTISELLVLSATTRMRPADGDAGAVAPMPANWPRRAPKPPPPRLPPAAAAAGPLKTSVICLAATSAAMCLRRMTS